MDFLSEVPDLELAEDGGKQFTFAADLFPVRPPFEVLQSFTAFSAAIQAQMEQALQQKKCPGAWVGLFVDERGMLALFHFKRRMTVAHAKSSAEVILHPLPPEQRRAVELGLRPLDELDQKRINAWKTPAALRPAQSDSESEESSDEGPRPMAELLAKEPPAKRRKCSDLALPRPPW